MTDAMAIVERLRVGRISGLLVLVALGAALATALMTDGPADPASRLDHARDLAFQHEPEHALLEVRRALAEIGDDGDRTLRLRALGRGAQIVDFHLGEGRTPEALAFYRLITKEFPGTPEAFDAGVRVADLLRERFHDAEHAEMQLLDVVAAYPNQAGVERLLLRAAHIDFDARRHAQARAIAERIGREFPGSELVPDAQMLIGTALHLEGRHRDAVAAFEGLAAAYPSAREAPLALVEAGNCLEEQGEHGLAMARFIEALPTHADPLAVQRRLELARRHLNAERAVHAGSKAYAFSHGVR